MYSDTLVFATRPSTELTARRQRTGTTEGEDTSPHPHSPKQADAFTLRLSFRFLRRTYALRGLGDRRAGRSPAL